MILTKENYFSPEASALFCGSTQFKDFVPELGGCEARALASIRGVYQRKTSSDMLFGKAVHAWSEGTLAQFKRDNMKELTKADGVTFLAKYQGIQDCIETIQRDDNMMAVLDGEKEVIMSAPMFGLDWKIMIDVYNPDGGFFTDLKCMRDFEFKWSATKRGKVSFIEYWGYDFQMAIYAEVERIASGRDEYLFPHIAAVTKQDPPDKAVFIGFKEQIPDILQRVAMYSPRIVALKSGEVEPIHCGNCEYCRSVKTAQFIDYTTWMPIDGDDDE
jgi:hypothetical protein